MMNTISAKLLLTALFSVASLSNVMADQRDQNDGRGSQRYERPDRSERNDEARRNQDASQQDNARQSQPVDNQRQGNADNGRRNGRMTQEEKQALRRQINEAGHDIYAPRR